MGNLCFEIERPEKAITYHLRALRISPNELQALIGLGNAYYDACKPEDAIATYIKALTFDNNIPDVHYNLANALFLTEDFE